MNDTYMSRATLGRIESDGYGNIELRDDLQDIWTYVLMTAGYKPSGTIAEYYFSECFPLNVIRAKATPEKETRADIEEYFFWGIEERPHLQRLEDTAFDNGIDSAIDAYFSKVPLYDIIA